MALCPALEPQLQGRLGHAGCMDLNAETIAVAEPLSWAELERRLPACSESELQLQRVEGPTNAQARLRLFGRPESEVRVTF